MVGKSCGAEGYREFDRIVCGVRPEMSLEA